MHSCEGMSKAHNNYKHDFIDGAKQPIDCVLDNLTPVWPILT